MIRNDRRCSLSKPGALILGTAELFPDGGHWMRYLRKLSQQEPSSGVGSAQRGFADLLAQGELPR